MGRLSREKGKVFERAVAREFERTFPGCGCHRSSQAERAYNPDIIFEAGPSLLGRLWLELQDARQPTPEKKLEQAERDAGRTMRQGWLPVVVWHRTAERTVWATTRVRTLRNLLSMAEAVHTGRTYPITYVLPAEVDTQVVTLRLDTILTLLRYCQEEKTP